MGKARAPKFDSMIDLEKLRNLLNEHNFTTRDVANMLERNSLGNVRGILIGDISMRVTDLTRILDKTGIKLSEIIKEDKGDLV